jgi:hypothetical protein
MLTLAPYFLRVTKQTKLEDGTNINNEIFDRRYRCYFFENWKTYKQ